MEVKAACFAHGVRETVQLGLVGSIYDNVEYVEYVECLCNVEYVKRCWSGDGSAWLAID